jgi:hypothetical protein
VTTYTIGQRVSIRPEWQDRGDAGRVFTIAELRGERLLLTCDSFADWSIAPQFVATVDMVEPARLSNRLTDWLNG